MKTSLLLAALVAGSAQASIPFTRPETTQVLHLDVETLADAQSIRHAVLVGWTRPGDDVVMEPMEDESGRKFFCVHLEDRE